MNSEDTAGRTAPAWDSTPAAAAETTDAGRSPPGRRPPAGTDKAKGKAAGRRTGERFATLNTFVDFTAGTLNRAELLSGLFCTVTRRDGTAATSQADIARRTGLCKRTVQLQLRRLEAAGLLKRVHRGGLRRGLPATGFSDCRKDTA